MIGIYAKDTVTHVVVSKDTWGSITTVQATYPARVAGEVEKVTSMGGGEATSTKQLLIEKAIVVGPKDKFIVLDPDGVSRTYPVVSVGAPKAFRKKFIKVWL